MAAVKPELSVNLTCRYHQNSKDYPHIYEVKLLAEYIVIHIVIVIVAIPEVTESGKYAMDGAVGTT